MSFDAVILCGGEARRLGGVDKAAIVVAGRSFLERATAAASGACRKIAVGPQRDHPAGLIWTREQPPGGGPVSALEAGMELVEESLVAVLGVDFPLLAAPTIASLVVRIEERDGAILRDGTGRHQFLIGVYRSDGLRRALAGAPSGGRAMKDLVAALDLEVIDDPRSTRDCDTWDEVRAAESALAEG